MSELFYLLRKKYYYPLNLLPSLCFSVFLFDPFFHTCIVQSCNMITSVCTSNIYEVHLLCHNIKDQSFCCFVWQATVSTLDSGTTQVFVGSLINSPSAKKLLVVLNYLSSNPLIYSIPTIVSENYFWPFRLLWWKPRII